jgi:hypothetical protein
MSHQASSDRRVNSARFRRDRGEIPLGQLKKNGLEPYYYCAKISETENIYRKAIINRC